MAVAVSFKHESRILKSELLTDTHLRASFSRQLSEPVLQPRVTKAMVNMLLATFSRTRGGIGVDAIDCH